MRVAVTGGHGMLGKAIVKALQEADHEPIQLSRGQLDIANWRQVQYFYDYSNHDAFINCAGALPGSIDNRMVATNATGPHNLARTFRKHIIHISTDCVFSGRLSGRWHFTSDIPDPIDLYGRSKAAGEPLGNPHVTVVRTSFIGFEHGLLPWLLSQEGNEITGWACARWSGSYVDIVARAIVALLNSPLRGPVHLAIQHATTKYDLLAYLIRELGLDIKIVSSTNPYINRSLAPTVVIPSVEDSIKEILDAYSSLRTRRTEITPSEISQGVLNFSTGTNGEAVRSVNN